jgi:hypothetical protein
LKDPPIDATDNNILTRQLGRYPRCVRAVLKRCKEGFPQVVVNSPLLPSTVPFPTVYWLTCPFLNRKIAVLENDGWIDRFQRMLAKDDCFQKAFSLSQEGYIEIRRRMVAEMTDLPGYAKEVLTHVGIGGVADLSRVKCLHAHYAHFLATGGNPIGERLGELIGKDDCPERCA